MQPESIKDSLNKLEQSGRKLKPLEVDFMKVIERENVQRALRLKALRKRNNITGLSLGGMVIGIYFYTMYSIKQEKFLDDFIEPAKVADD